MKIENSLFGLSTLGKTLESEGLCPRMVLCILLTLCLNCYYLVEQPAQSLLRLHKRWQFLANRVSYVPWRHDFTKKKVDKPHPRKIWDVFLIPGDIPCMSIDLKCFVDPCFQPGLPSLFLDGSSWWAVPRGAFSWGICPPWEIWTGAS